MTFIREIWSKEIQMENANYNSIEDLVTSFQDDNSALVVGDSVHVPVISLADATDPGVWGLVTFEDASPDEVIITISTEKNSAFTVKDIEQAQTNIDLRNSYAKASAMKLKEARDKSILALAGWLTQAVGTYGADIDEDTILEAKMKLDKAKAPKMGRILVVSSKDETALLKIDRFTAVDKYGAKATVIADWEVGKIHWFTVVMSELVKSVDNAGTIETDCVAFVKETFGIAYSLKDRVNAQYDINYKKWKVVTDCLYGVKTIRPEFGVLVKS